MEGLLSPGIALLFHVEWPWIALTTPFRLITAGPYLSRSKQWLLLVVVTRLKHILWSTLVTGVAVFFHPVSCCLHLCGICNKRVRTHVHTKA